MSDTLLVSTRKGLFTVARKARAWEITARRFPRRQRHAHADRPARRAPLRGARSRPFRRQAASLDRDRLGGDRGAGLSAEAGGLRRERHVGPAAAVEHGAHLGACRRRRRRARRHLVRHAAGRPVPLDRSRAELGDGPRRCGIIPSASSGWAAAPTCRAFIRSASTRAIRSACGSRSRPAASGSPRTPARAGRQRGEGMRAEHVPPELTHDPIAQDVHCLVQCPARAAAHVGAAPQRHLRLLRRGQDVHRDQRRRAVDVRLCRRRCIRAIPTRRGSSREIKDEKRIPRDGKLVVTRTRDGGKTFEVLTKGLPQSHAYDVVYRHALALDRDRRPPRLRLDHRRPVGERGSRATAGSR